MALRILFKLYSTQTSPCYTTVNGINESGRLVGIYQDQAGQFHAFLFSCTAGDLSACPGSSFTTLDPAGPSIRKAALLTRKVKLWGATSPATKSGMASSGSQAASFHLSTCRTTIQSSGRSCLGSMIGDR
jgi:hypothetical protein